jgi:hypothetical protein
VPFAAERDESTVVHVRLGIDVELKLIGAVEKLLGVVVEQPGVKNVGARKER